MTQTYQLSQTARPLRLSFILFTVIALLTGASIWLAAANEYPLALMAFSAGEPLAAFVAGLIITRQPRNNVGWFIAGHAICFTLGEFCRQVALYGGVTNPGSIPFVQAFAWPAYWLWGPGLLFGFILLPLYFPNGRLISPAWRPATVYAVVTTLLFTLGMAFSPGDHETPGVNNPLGLLAQAQIDAWYGRWIQAWWLIGMVLGVLSLFVRFYRADFTERQQLKWILYAMVLLLLIPLVPTELLVGELIASTMIALLWIAIGMAVLRYRLYNIDIIINRTLVYAALTGAVAGAYLLTVGGLAIFIPSGSNLFNALIAAALVAIIFQPLRERLQRGVNRLLYGERDEPYSLLNRLGRRFEDALAPERALPTLVETVGTALKLPYVAIALYAEQELEHDADQAASSGDSGATVLTLVAEYQRPGSGTTAGHPPEQLVTLPLTHQRQIVGELRLALRPGEQSFGQADWQLLNELARQIGVTVSAAQLTHALQQARERLIMAREEERRRLRRDLHDGLGPLLAAQRLKLGSARYFLQHNPALADKLLAEQERDIDAALVDVRRLVDNLRPPALDDLGLAAALQRIAAQVGIVDETAPSGVMNPAAPSGGIISQAPNGEMDTNNQPGLRVAVDIPATLPPLPAAVEVACYRIVQEALHNVVRHAQAQQCRISLAIGAADTRGAAKAELPGKWLHLTICDDGRGLSTRQETVAQRHLQPGLARHTAAPTPSSSVTARAVAYTDTPSTERGSATGSGLGLHSMRERAAELGGRMLIRPNTPQGTCIEVYLPLP